MELTIQAKKRQKCFTIDPKDGTTQFVPTFTTEEEQSFAISQLELWKKAGAIDGKEVMDANHVKLLQFQDISARTAPSTTEENSDGGRQQEKLKNAFESAQRAAAELTMLVQLTNLIASNKILSLQTCYDSSVLADTDGDPENEQLSAKATTAPKVIPLAQIIGIQRKSMGKAQASLQCGLERMKQLVQQRNAFSETLRTCTEDKSFVLCYVDRKSNKRVLNRKYDPRKDYIAVDCSIATDASLKEPPKSVVPPTAQLEATTKAVSSYVPIHMDKAGLALSEGEQNAPIYTLQAQLILRDEFSKQAALAGSVCSWDLLHPAAAAASTGTSARACASEDDATAGLTQHFQRRKHETLCKTAFAQLREECIRGSTQWDLFSGICETAVRPLSSAKDWARLQAALREENILQSIVVVDVQESSVLLRVSAWLQLSISLVPIASDTDAAVHSDGYNKWVHDTLASMLVQSLLSVLRPVTAVPVPAVKSVSSQSSIVDSSAAGVLSAPDSTGYWNSKFATKKGTALSNGSAEAQSGNIARDMLGHLRSRVEKLRAAHTGSGSTAMDTTH